MAAFGNVEAMLTGITDDVVQRIMKAVFRYTLKDIRFGQAVAGAAAANLGGGFFSAKTPSAANQEFAVPHSFGRAPYLLIPVMPLNQVGAACVRLTNSRVADATNVYLKSPETSQTVFFYLEG